MAAEQIGALDIPADLRKGGRVDALKHALGANAVHGQRRTNADKRRCVELAIKEFASLSSRAIAELCGVSKTFVENIRPSEVATVATCRTGADGKQYPATRRTSKPATPEEEEAAAQNGGRSTGEGAPLPPPPAPAASHAPTPPRLSEVRRPTPPALRRAPAPFVPPRAALLGAGGEPRTRQPHPAVGSPPPNSLRPLPASVSRGPRLPGVAGRGSPPRAAPATPRRRRSCSPAVRSVTTSLTLPPPFRFSPRTPLSPPTAIRPQSWPD